MAILNNAASGCPNFVQIPENWSLVSDTQELRQGQQVWVQRWQPEPKLEYGQPQITVVTAKQGLLHLLGYRDTTKITPGNPISDEQALLIALQALSTLSAEYTEGLTYLYVHVIPLGSGRRQVSWVKFAHYDGSFTMVSINSRGEVCALDLAVAWDYARQRRSTEEWDNDDWLRALYKMGPQLAPPHALAEVRQKENGH
jgi:hypothetical protein